jgi:dihydropteroate synthase
VNALQEAGAVEMAASLEVPVCLMHMQGLPETMQDKPSYQNVVDEVTAHLQARANACVQQGISKERILLDPGFGFGKTTAHNLLLLQQLERLVETGFPVLVGLSRKSLIGKVLDLPVDKRLYPGLALAVLAVWKGATLVRCHDIRPTCEALAMCQAVREAAP